MTTVRAALSATCIALATVFGVALVAPDARAQTTTPIEFFVGTVLTAKQEHRLERTLIAKGTKGKVTKVYTSSTSGKITHLDVQVGKVSATKVAVQTIRDNYSH